MPSAQSLICCASGNRALHPKGSQQVIMQRMVRRLGHHPTLPCCWHLHSQPSGWDVLVEQTWYLQQVKTMRLLPAPSFNVVWRYISGTPGVHCKIPLWITVTFLLRPTRPPKPFSSYSQGSAKKQCGCKQPQPQSGAKKSAYTQWAHSGQPSTGVLAHLVAFT